LRIGYVSAFFGARNWMKPVWGVINNHDRAAFELHLFSDGQDPSAESGYRDHPADYVHAIEGVSNAELAGHVARAGIDILIDLNGYSFQQRLGLFARHPAPVTIGWFNIFATSGLAGLDYVIADAAVVPPEEERFYGERVLRVAGSYLAFSVLYPVPDVAPPPSRGGAGLVFGCLCSQYKITEAVVTAWARILCGAPHARMLVKNARLDDASNRRRLHQRFAAHGVAPDRVLLEGGAEHFAFLEAYARVDVALDSFPYNGGTTTTEALWQGVPVLTFNGDRWASRTSRSLLEAAGLGAWVMPTSDAYVEEAIALAQGVETPRRLAKLRAGMRHSLQASPVCDSAGLCRQLERIFREIAA
jgi:predicted O-linked N-acetylglucosamine transferase (SPINDLY family)